MASGGEGAAAEETDSVNPYWNGDGGGGKSIAILELRESGLAENERYLTSVVQGELLANFTGYSALNVLDRKNLDDQYAELLSDYYDDNAAALDDFGHLIPMDYLMDGDITKTQTGYALQIRVTRSADKMTVASYSGVATFAEMENFVGIRRASLELLQKLGVEPTERTKTELAGAATARHVEAQNSVAKGINAERRGTEVEALSYYFQAAALDASLAEAASRSSVMFAHISSGNIGDDTRNLIAWREDWYARLAETERYFDEFFSGNAIPYTFFYISKVYPGDINYQTGTQNLETGVNLRPVGAWTWLSSVERALQAVYDGLNATQRKDEWGFGQWPARGVTDRNPFVRKSKTFDMVMELVNSNGKVIGESAFRMEGYWEFMMYSDRSPQIAVSLDDNRGITFSNVNANDITDNLTIRMVSVNSVDPASAGLNIKAVSEETWVSNSVFTMSKNVITGCNVDLENKIIEISDVWDEPVIIIGDGAFRNRGLAGLTIGAGSTVVIIGAEAFADNCFHQLALGNNITEIGNRAFYNAIFDVDRERGLLEQKARIRLAIPDSVTSIGDEAFAENRIEGVTIGIGCKSIGKHAFVNEFSINDHNGKVYFSSYIIDRIKIGADVTIDEEAFHYKDEVSGERILRDNGFLRKYVSNGRIAGTYSKPFIGPWQYTP